MGIVNYNIQRFLDAQMGVYSTALKEIKDGHKESDWIRYIFPQLKGLGHSYNSDYYGLNDVFEAIEYFNNPILQARLVETTDALIHHKEKSFFSILSEADVKKVLSCASLFHTIDPDNTLFEEVIDIINLGDIDKETIDLVYDGFRKDIISCYSAQKEACDVYFEKIIDDDILRNPLPICDLNVKNDLNNKCWRIGEYLFFGDFIVENDQVFLGVFDLHTGPPDYLGENLQSIPFNLLLTFRNKLLNY